MKKIIKKDKILKWTAVFIIATTMVMSTTAVTANISSINTKRSESNIGPIGDILLDEGFEDGVMPPPGWSVDVSNPDYTWEIVDAASEPDLVHSGDYAAVVRWCGITYQDELLTSPEVDLTPDYGSANLSFWVNCWTFVSGATLKVYIEKNGDGINHKIWDMQGVEDWPEAYYRQVNLSISEFIGNTVNIKWHYDGMSLVCDLGLDDILVYTGPKPIPPELEIGEITGGWAGFGNGAKVSAEIKNVAPEDAEDARDVEWSISVIGNGLVQEINESDNGTIPVIAPGGLEIVELIAGRHFGKVNITVTAYEPHWDIFVSKSVDGFFLIFFILILK